MAAPQVAQLAALALAVAGVAGDGQRLGVQVDGPPVVTQAGSGSSPGCPARCPRPAVAGVAGDGQRLGVQVDGLPVVTQAGSMPQVAQLGLALPVADVAGDGQRLGVQVDGLPVLTQAAVAAPGCPAGRPRLAVADVAGDGQRLGVQVDGLPVLTQAGEWQFPRLPRWAAFRAGSVIRPWMRPCSSIRVR